MVDETQRLQVLLRRESTFYTTSDYLTRMQEAQEPVYPSYCTTSRSDDGSSEDKEEIQPGSKKRKNGSTPRDSESSQSPSKRNNVESSASPNRNPSSDGSSSQINKHWREKICEWAYQVVDHFDLNREVVSITMSHLDRYLDTCDYPVDKNLFQLLAMTSLYLAIKLNEYKHLIIPGSKSSMDTILQLSRGCFTLEQMEKMECNILQRLQWHVHPPTPQLFVKHFLFFLSPEEQDVHDLAQFLAELSVMDYFFVSYKPSEVAIAALLNAVEDLLPHRFDQLDFSFLGSIFCPHSQNIHACRERLALIYAQANDHPTTTTESPVVTPDNTSKGTSIRTTSPVSVMAAPQPCRYHGAAQHVDDAMDAEHSDDEDL